MIEGQLLILLNGSKPAPALIALDKDTGAEIWKALETESAAHSSPIVVKADGTRQLIVWTQQGISGLDPKTGKVYWREAMTAGTDVIVSTPIYSNPRLLMGGLMMELDADKPGFAIRWPEGRVISKRFLSNTSTALLLGDHVYSAKSSGELVCLEASTGNQVWSTNSVTDQKNGASIHLTLNGDSVLLFNDRGELIRARLSPKGYEELSRARVIEPTYPFGGRNVTWSPASYADKRVFARNDRELVCASLDVEQ